jgi:hypothetical protein
MATNVIYLTSWQLVYYTRGVEVTCVAYGGVLTFLGSTGIKWKPIIESGTSHCKMIMWIVVRNVALNQCFRACIIQPIFLGYFKVKAPSIL